MMSVRAWASQLYTEAMMIAGVMMPAKDASTCWRLQGSMSLIGGMPSRVNRASCEGAEELLAISTTAFFRLPAHASGSIPVG